jgi:hypothetical protein
MARAVIYVMIKGGIRHLCIYNRMHQKAMELSRHFESLRNEGFHKGSRNLDQSNSNPATITTLESFDDLWPSRLRFPTVIVNYSPIPGDRLTLVPFTHPGSVGLKPAVSIPDVWL